MCEPRSREALAWAGGFFEGEGCIVQGRYSATGGVKSGIALSAAQASLEPLERLMAAMDLGTINGPYAPKSQLSRTALWTWRVGGFEKVQAVIAMLWPYLSARRKAKARAVLAVANEARRRCPDSRRWAQGKSTHTRWHVGRDIVKVGCRYCEAA